MINETAALADDVLTVLEGIELHGKVNVDDETLLANVRSAIRRPYPQMQPCPPKPERIVLVGGGPSLADTEDELIALLREPGTKLVTVNGAYKWCLERNLTPKTQIVMDARASNRRFLDPELPECRYILASQCHPDTWNAVNGREHVWMFHAAAGADGPMKDLLDAFYCGNWFGVGGGTTVVSRALSLLRTAGYLRYDLFGVDSCWMHGIHHAYEQPENINDRPLKFTAHPVGHPEMARTFTCSPWHAKQIEDLLQMLKVNGEHFMLNVHGDGLFAYLLSNYADLAVSVEESEPLVTTAI